MPHPIANCCMKGACVAALQAWPDGSDAKPDLSRIESFVDDVEGDT